VSFSVVKSVLLALAVVLVVAAPAAAQDDTHGAVGLGPSFLSWQDEYGVLAKGVSADLAHPFGGVGSRLRWVADVGIMWEPGVTDSVVTGGVRFTIPAGRVNVDVQGMFGVAHWEAFGGGATAFTAGPGVAVRYWINDRLGLKGQIDYQIPNWDFGKIYRTWIGIVIGLPAG
jgi:hypothetical protein